MDTRTVLRRRGYKFRLKPTEPQAATMAQFVGACRFVFNLGLEQRRDYWRPGRHITYMTQAADLTKLRAEVDWINALPVHALQQALRDLDRAFVNFFEGRACYPTPRVKGIHDSFRVPQNCNCLRVNKLNAKWSALKLPKLGWVKYRAHRAIDGEICNATVSFKGGHWWVSVQTERDTEVHPSALPPVGVDRGVTALVALSSGEIVVPVNALKKHLRRLKNAQRCLARRRKGSRRWKRQKARVSRIHIKIANARSDQLHKVSLDIACRFGTVVIEDLKTKNMTASAAGTVDEPGHNVAQKSGLNRAILDKGWRKLETFLAYKLEERGGALIKVNPAFTSQTCPCCGHVAPENRKSQAEFKCVNCFHEENADIVGAKNILRAGVRPQSAPSEPRRRSATRTVKRSALRAA